MEQLSDDLLINNKYGRDIIEKIMEETEKINYSIEEYARQIFEIFGSDEEILKSIMEFLIVITIIEIGFPEEEDRYLRKIAKAFKINELEYFNIKNRCINSGNCELTTESILTLRKEIEVICSCDDFLLRE